jgi:hypothetical protein
MTHRYLRSVVLVTVCGALAACSLFLNSTQSALENTTGQGSLVVPAGSAASACAPRPVQSDQGTLLITEGDRKSIAAGITRTSVVESGTVTSEDSRALYRSAAGSPDSAVSDKAVQSASSALDILSSPTHKKMLALMALATSPSNSRDIGSTLASGVADVPTLKIDRREWVKYTNTVAAVSMTDGWTALSVYTENRLASVSADDSTRSALTGLHRESTLISAYLAAYFRQGKFVSLTINPSQFDSELQTKVNSWLKDAGGAGAAATPGNLVGAISSDVLPSQCKASASGAAPPPSCTLLGNIGQTGFVTRSGDKYAFPALTFQLDPLGQQKLTKPQVEVKNVIGDLVRVVLEATGDALYQVPAAQGSTACTTGLLSCYDPSKATVSADNFTKVNQYAAEAETVASGGIGLLVRGGFWVALNNENLATAVETGVGVTARKTAERVAWDYLSCANPSGDFRAVAVSGGAYRTLAVTLQ